jgi:hypothetical protein
MTLSTRKRLLASAVLGSGLAALLPTQASAQCTLAAPNLTCLSTTTVDTNYPTNSGTGTDRNYIDVGAQTTTIGSGVTVDGFGLGIAYSQATAPFSVTNDGAIQVDVGNTPTATFGGQGALNLATNATPIVYSGTGSITNLGTGEGFFARLFFGGTIDANFGGSVRADNGDAIRISATDPTVGAITVVTNSVTASGGDGIDISTSGSGLVSVTANNGIQDSAGAGALQNGILVSSTGTGGITIRQTAGAIGTTVNRAALRGIDAQITNAASAGVIDIGTSGGTGINTVGDGIFAQTAGTGDVIVNAGGAINTSAGDGIEARSTSGALTITSSNITSVGGQGILAASTTGNQIINVNGPISSSLTGVTSSATTGTITVNVNGNITSTGVGLQLNGGSGPVTVNVAAGQTIDSTGSFDVIINGTGLATVNNSGTIGAAGNTNIAIGNNAFVTPNDINNLAGGVINGNYDLGNLVDTIDNAGTLNLTASSFFYDGNDVITNLSGGIINLGAGTVLDFSSGTDSFVNNAGGTVNLNGAASMTGLETTTNNGTLNLNTFVLTGSGAFTNGTTGLVDTSGSASLIGYSSMTNNGVFDLAAGTFTVPAVVFTNGTTGIVRADEGLTTFTGQTSFANNGTIDLQDGATGDNLTIASAYVGGAGRLQVDSTTTLADQLIVNGNTSGSTFVDVNLIGAAGLFAPVLVVNDTTTTGGAFTIGNVSGNASPLVTYSITQIAEDYFLSTALNPAAFSPLVVTRVVYDMWYQSADEVIAQTRLPDDSVGLGVWGQVYGSIDKSGAIDEQVILGVPYDADNKIETNRYGIQAGVDYGFGAGRIGLTAGYGKANANGDVQLKAKGWNVGIYGAFGGELGFHGEALAKYDKYDIDFEDGPLSGISTDGHSWGVDGALGYRFQAGAVPILDLNVGLSHVRSTIDDIDVLGFGYDYDRMTSTRARGGLRAYFNGGWRPYLDLTGYHEFDGDGDVTLFDGTSFYDLESTGKATWVRLEGGLAGQVNRGPMLAAWGELGDRKGAGIRLGFRFGGAREEAPLPPPPPPMAEPAPPPPPPPATQTCADGSVILATDSCPPPPPPPPPAAEPERG